MYKGHGKRDTRDREGQEKQASRHKHDEKGGQTGWKLSEDSDFVAQTKGRARARTEAQKQVHGDKNGESL